MELLTASLTASKSSKKNSIPVMGIEASDDAFSPSFNEATEASMNEFSGESANAQFFQTAERAYYKSEARGFAPGHDWEDWLAAEAEVLQDHTTQGHAAQGYATQNSTFQDEAFQ